MLPPRKKQRLEGGPKGPSVDPALRDVSNSSRARRGAPKRKHGQSERGCSGPSVEVVAERPAPCGSLPRGASDELDDAQSSRPPVEPVGASQEVAVMESAPLTSLDPVLENALHALGRSMDDALRSAQGASVEFEAGVRHALRLVAMGMARHAGMLQP